MLCWCPYDTRTADEHLAELMPIFERLRQQEQIPCAFPLHMGAGGMAFIRGGSRSTPLSPHAPHCHPSTHWVSDETGAWRSPTLWLVTHTRVFECMAVAYHRGCRHDCRHRRRRRRDVCCPRIVQIVELFVVHCLDVFANLCMISHAYNIHNVIVPMLPINNINILRGLISMFTHTQHTHTQQTRKH